MAEVTGFTADRMRIIENETVVDGEVRGDNLFLLTREGIEINAGNVRGPAGAQGPQGPLDQATADALYVNLTGDTMTGRLSVLTGATAPGHAIPKADMDAAISAAVASAVAGVKADLKIHSCTSVAGWTQAAANVWSNFSAAGSTAPVPVIAGRKYLATVWVPWRYGTAGSSVIDVHLVADGVEIIAGVRYGTYVANERDVSFASEIWVPAASGSPVIAAGIRNSLANGLQSTGAAFGWSIIPVP